MSGRIAAKGISEVGYGLPKAQLKALDAVASPDVDPSQCATILAYGLHESAKSAVEKHCGDFDALNEKRKAVPASEQAKTIIAACKLGDVGEKDVQNLNPWAVLLSAILVEELSADPASNDDEKKVARAVANTCRLADPK